MAYVILTINPGSTSTKIGVFEDGKQLFTESVSHSAEEIASFPSIASQYEFREQHIRGALEKRGFDLKKLSAVVGRGGLLKPIPGGVYRVNEAMKRELLEARNGEHASNLGALIAGRLSEELGVPAFIADPVVVDELDDVARVAGHKLFAKKSIFHALNQKAVARRWSKEQGKDYGKVNLIVALMGGGVSVGLHREGKVVDVNQALNGDGPFSPERSGGLPTGELVKICFSGKYSEKEVFKMLTGQGGIVSYLGTNDMREVEKRELAGDPDAILITRAFCYKIAREIGALAAANHGKVDGIILTGGIAYQKTVVDDIRARVEWIAPLTIYPGEGELEALALAGTRALSGEAVAMTYEG
jgi:butyrate kinase